VKRRAALLAEIHDLSQVVGDHVATLAETHREIDLRLQALRGLESPRALDGHCKMRGLEATHEGAARRTPQYAFLKAVAAALLPPGGGALGLRWAGDAIDLSKDLKLFPEPTQSVLGAPSVEAVATSPAASP
jgi:hypothetical protein